MLVKHLLSERAEADAEDKEGLTASEVWVHFSGLRGCGMNSKDTGFF